MFIISERRTKYSKSQYTKWTNLEQNILNNFQVWSRFFVNLIVTRQLRSKQNMVKKSLERFKYQHIHLYKNSLELIFSLWKKKLKLSEKVKNPKVKSSWKRKYFPRSLSKYIIYYASTAPDVNNDLTSTLACAWLEENMRGCNRK